MRDPRVEYRVHPPLVGLILGHIRALTRDVEAIFWVVVFPVALTAVLGLAFRVREPEALPVAVVEGRSAAARLAALQDEPDLKPIALSEAEVSRALARGRVVLVVGPSNPPVYSYDPTRPESRSARLIVDAALQNAAGRRDAFAAVRFEVATPGARYIDFLVPGLLGMSLMSAGMWGMGYSTVVARIRNVLRRLVAAPSRRSHLLGAQLMARLLFLVPQITVLLLFARFVFDVPLRGPILLFVGVALLGALAFSGIGLLAASRARTIEGVTGLMNLFMVPMWIFSGIFFSAERFPASAQLFIQALPLTALNDALRGVMLDGVGLGSLVPDLALLAAWGGISFLIALKIFRWH